MSIIVGYVPTPVGKAALDAAIAESKLRNEELLIVNSSREGALVDKNTASSDDWKEVEAVVSAAGIDSQIIESTYRDDLTEEFLRIATERKASLIVIGLRQRTQVGKFIMGSHAQRILLQADRPVLAVKANAH